MGAVQYLECSPLAVEALELSREVWGYELIFVALSIRGASQRKGDDVGAGI